MLSFTREIASFRFLRSLFQLSLSLVSRSSEGTGFLYSEALLGNFVLGSTSLDDVALQNKIRRTLMVQYVDNILRFGNLLIFFEHEVVARPVSLFLLPLPLPP